MHDGALAITAPFQSFCHLQHKNLEYKSA